MPVAEQCIVLDLEALGPERSVSAAGIVPFGADLMVRASMGMPGGSTDTLSPNASRLTFHETPKTTAKINHNGKVVTVQDPSQIDTTKTDP